MYHPHERILNFLWWVLEPEAINLNTLIWVAPTCLSRGLIVQSGPRWIGIWWDAWIWQYLIVVSKKLAVMLLSFSSCIMRHNVVAVVRILLLRYCGFHLHHHYNYLIFYFYLCFNFIIVCSFFLIFNLQPHCFFKVTFLLIQTGDRHAPCFILSCTILYNSEKKG